MYSLISPPRTGFRRTFSVGAGCPAGSSRQRSSPACRARRGSRARCRTPARLSRAAGRGPQVTLISDLAPSPASRGTRQVRRRYTPDPGISGDLLRSGRMNHHNGGASGAVNRLLRPDSVRHMSVTTATRRLTGHIMKTQRDKKEKARETGNPPLTGRFRRWWQVLGSNQRRLSRRFYSEPIPAHRYSR